MAQANEVIARFGGQSALARALGVNQSTVQHWAKTGQIPSWRLDQVERAAQDLGIVLPGGGTTAAGGRLPSSAPPSMSATRMGMQGGARAGTPAELARQVLAGARGAVQAPPNPPAGQMGVPHGRADFTPNTANVEWEIGALRDEIGQLRALLERLVGEVAALREGSGAGGAKDGARGGRGGRGGERQGRSTRSTSRS